MYSVSKKTVGTNMARTVARRPRKLVSINLALSAGFLKIINYQYFSFKNGYSYEKI